LGHAVMLIQGRSRAMSNSTTWTARMVPSRLRIDFRQFVGDVEWPACAESSSG
jgi:hypothetical protein